MAFIDKEDIHDLYVDSKAEADVWRENYHELERLADNDLIEDLDESLPEVNDGSLAASLFKLPKRIVSSKLTGRAKALDTDDAWITELANMQWENKIVPNANSQAPYHRKWKDAVRKAAIYGGQPIITLFVQNGNYTGSDIINPQAGDVTLEAGKVSDYDSDIIFWDIFLSKKQVKDMLEQAKAENAEAAESKKEWKARKAEADALRATDPTLPPFEDEEPEPYNKWDVAGLQKLLESKEKEERQSRNEHNKRLENGVRTSGFHFYIAFQRGVNAPFYMCHANEKDGKPSRSADKKYIREWTNPDPTGDVPVHYLYCYQDFINPYGIGIVKLAGGTQNVLDHMRQADVLATDIGIRPPKLIKGNPDDVDEESMVYAQDANWYVGSVEVERLEMSSDVYRGLPGRISMYKTSLNQLIPTGDTSISATDSGDPNYSKTDAGVDFQKANLSIDDDDFKDNLYMTYAAVAKSMINTHFANMQGHDLMRLSDDERELLVKGGMEWPVDEETGELLETNEVDILWDEVRATFDFEVDPEQDKAKDDEQQLEGLLKVVDLVKDPATQTLIASGQPLILGTKKLDPGELISEVITRVSDNKKIIVDVTPEDQEAMAEEAQAAEAMAMEQETQGAQGMPGNEGVAEGVPEDVTPEQAAANIQAVMQQYGVDEQTAAVMLEAEYQGFEPEEILGALQRQQEVANVA